MPNLMMKQSDTQKITNFRTEGRKIVGTPIFSEWLSGIESWKEVLQEAEAHTGSLVLLMTMEQYTGFWSHFLCHSKKGR